MTNEEAIERLSKRFFTVSQCINAEEAEKENEALRIAIDSINKQIGKPYVNKTMVINHTCGDEEFEVIACPDCGSIVAGKFCNECGQKVQKVSRRC